MQLSGWLTRDRLAVLAALAAPLAVCAAMTLVRDTFANTDAALVLVLVVVAVAANGNRVAGVLAAVSAAVWFDFFLTRPYGHFTITRRSDIETTVLILAVGILVTELAVWGRRKAALASGQAGYLSGIRAATEAASRGGSAMIVGDVADQLTQLLGLHSCHFEYGVAGVGNPARLRQDGEVEWHREPWNVEERGLPHDVDIELIVESGGRLMGRYLMRAAANSHPTQTQRFVAVTLAAQVGGVLGQPAKSTRGA